MAGIRLAETASLPRLSLMCEVASSQLVDSSNFCDALQACEEQKKDTANPLPFLRKAAMEVVFSGPRAVYVLPSFRQALQERGEAMVPTILTGAMEAIENEEVQYHHQQHHQQHHSSPAANKNKRKAEHHHWQIAAFNYFPVIDRRDFFKREEERLKRRRERGILDEAPPAKKSKKRPPARKTAVSGMPRKMMAKRSQR
jgi:hypothetical protein